MMLGSTRTGAVSLAVACMIALPELLGAGSPPKAYRLERLAKPVAVDDAKPRRTTISLDELEQRVREAVTQRTTPSEPIPLGGFTNILGYRWNDERREVELIGETGGPAAFRLYAEQLAVALRLAVEPFIVVTIVPSGLDPWGRQRVVAYPETVLDTHFLEPLIQADYYMKAIVMNHVSSPVPTPLDGLETVILDCRVPPNIDELLGASSNIFFQPVDPRPVTHRTKGGFQRSIRDVGLRLRPGRHVSDPYVIEFARRVSSDLDRLVESHPRALRPLVNLHRLYMVAQLLMVEEEAEIDLSYWLSEFPLTPHPTPRELPSVRSKPVGRFCEGPAVDYEKSLRSWQLWGGVILGFGHELEKPDHRDPSSGVYRSGDSLLVIRSDSTFRAKLGSTPELRGRVSREGAAALRLVTDEREMVVTVTEDGLAGRDGRLWARALTPADSQRSGEAAQRAEGPPDGPPAQHRPQSLGPPPSTSGLPSTAPDNRLRTLLERLERVLNSSAPQRRGSSTTFVTGEKLTETLSTLEARLATLERGSGTGRREQLRTLLDLSRLHRIVGDLEAAREEAGRALEVARTTADGERLHAEALTALAAANRDAGRYGTAVLQSERALAMCREHLVTADPAYVEALVTLARIHQETGDSFRARVLYREALEIEERLPPDARLAHSRILNNLGVVHLERADYRKARSQLAAALNRRLREGELGGPLTLSILNNLARLHSVEERVEEAVRLYRLALELLESTGLESLSIYPTLLNNLAVELVAQGRPKAAERTVRRALEVVRSRYHKRHPLYAALLNSLGVTYWSLGKLRRARNLYQEALQVLEEHPWERHVQRAVTLSNLGQVRQFEGRTASAREAFERAALIIEEVLGRDHPLRTRMLDLLGKLYLKEGRYANAYRYTQEAQEILQRTGHGHGSSYSRLLYRALMLRWRDRRPEGLEILDLVTQLIGSDGAPAGP